MMIWIDWSKSNRGLLMLVLDWATPLTQVVTKAMLVSPGGRYVPGKRTRWRKLGGWVMLGDSLWLGPLMLRQNPVFFIAEFVTRTCRCWLMVTTSFCSTFRAANTFRAISVWGWRRQAGKCWIMRGTPWVQQKRQRERIMRVPLVVRDREYPFSEDVLVDETGAVDPNLGVMAKVSSLIEVLRLGGSYELVYRLWAQFTLSAVRVNVDVTWSRDEVLVSIYILLRIFYVACVHPLCWLF